VREIVCVCVCICVWAHYYRNVWKKLCIAIGAGKVEKWKSVGVGGNLKPKHAAAAEKLAM